MDKKLSLHLTFSFRFFVYSLKVMEKTLSTVQNMQGDCLKQLEEQLEMQRKIAAMTHDTVENQIISNLFEIALNCDIDGDMKLSQEEVDKLIHKIETINGVDIKEEKIRNLITTHGSDIMGKKMTTTHFFFLFVYVFCIVTSSYLILSLFDNFLLKALMEVTKNLLKHDIPDDDKLFVIL